MTPTIQEEELASLPTAFMTTLSRVDVYDLWQVPEELRVERQVA
jgi:hypothetical protein